MQWDKFKVGGKSTWYVQKETKKYAWEILLFPVYSDNNVYKDGCYLPGGVIIMK